MSEEVIINVAQHETRVAVLSQGLLQEVYVERQHTPGTVGNIYRGKVVRILPGMQSAFVAIGQERAAFMHISDLIDIPFSPSDDRSSLQYPPITDVLHDGKELLVQVTKEPIGTKGARVTSNISIASRYLVYMPDTTHIGISQRIEDPEERTRLREIINGVMNEGDSDGFIVRTASEGVEEPEIREDARLLRQRWQVIEADSKMAKAETTVYEDLPLPLRTMRDIINGETFQISVNQQETFDVVSRFLEDFIPGKKDCLELVSNGLFERHNVEDQIEQALDRKVPLKSGGYLVIDQTEAMTTIDVNTGAYVGRKDLEETIYRTNLEAAAAIPRQLRLRAIGGIVIIDFIDMLDEEHKRQVLRTLEKGQQTDRVRWKISQFSDLGLVEMSRKRSRESLLKRICEPCPACDGAGFIKSAESVCLEVFRDIQRRRQDFGTADCLILASQEVVDRLIDEDADLVKSLAEQIGCAIKVQVDTSYTQPQFDVVATSRD